MAVMVFGMRILEDVRLRTKLVAVLPKLQQTCQTSKQITLIAELRGQIFDKKCSYGEDNISLRLFIVDYGLGYRREKGSVEFVYLIT